MRFAPSVLVLAVLVLPVTASAQHHGGRAAPSGGMPHHPGPVHGGMPHQQHPGMQHPLMNQFNMMQQMMMQEAYMQQLRLQQQARRQAAAKGQPGMQKVAPHQARSSLRGSPKTTTAIRSLSTAPPGSATSHSATGGASAATSHQPKNGASAATSHQPKNGKSAAATHGASTVQSSTREMQTMRGRAMASQARSAKKSTTESKAVRQALEKERARQHRRREAFLAWLARNGLLANYVPWFQANSSVLAFENWLADQQMRRLQGLPTDPMYDQFLAFQGQYTY